MLSLILPTRNWPADRIDACVRSFLRLKSKTLTEIIVVDFGSDEPIKVRSTDKRVRTIRVDAERWSLAEAINTGVVNARNPVVAKTDADIIIARESGPGIDAAVASLMAGEIGGAVVQATDLPEGMEAAEALAAKSDDLAATGRLRARWGQGGLCLFTVADWNEIGGFEARYYGWGNEDNDFADRMRRAGRRMRWLKQDAVRIFHVWHPITRMAKDIVKARSANMKIYTEDKSTYRPTRFPHSKRSPLASPNIVTRPRPLVTVSFASKARPNRERMITEAIRGFAGQIDNDFEVLIGDNGSSEEERLRLSKALTRLPKSLNVRVIDIERPSIPATRNRLNLEAEGRYICIADDDDIPFPDRLADHLAPFEKTPNIHGTHGGWVDFDELTGIIDYNTGGERTLANLMYGPGKASAHPATFLRTDVARHFRYDEGCHVGSDFDMTVRMASMGCVVDHTGSYVTLRRFHHSNVTITGLADQLSVGTVARARVTETLGNVYERKLREQAKTAKVSIWCRNKHSKDTIMEMMPGYSGVWRLLVRLSALDKDDDAPVAGVSLTSELPGVTQPAEPPPAPAMTANVLARAQTLADILEGDIGTVDVGLNPDLYFISQPIKGSAKALKLRRQLERELDFRVDVVPEVEYQQRRGKKFDWRQLSSKPNFGRLISEPIHRLDEALMALAKLPDHTAMRAMTAILADFNCTDPLYHLVTNPMLLADGPGAARRRIEHQTGHTFKIVGDGYIN